MYRVTEYILDDRVSGLTIWTGKSGTFISFIAKPKDFPGKPSVLCYKKSKQKEIKGPKQVSYLECKWSQIYDTFESPDCTVIKI